MKLYDAIPGQLLRAPSGEPYRVEGVDSRQAICRSLWTGDALGFDKTALERFELTEAPANAD